MPTVQPCKFVPFGMNRRTVDVVAKNKKLQIKVDYDLFEVYQTQLADCRKYETDEVITSAYASKYEVVLTGAFVSGNTYTVTLNL